MDSEFIFFIYFLENINDSKSKKFKSDTETEEERADRLERQRTRASTSRANETNEQYRSRLQDLQVRAQRRRAVETNEQRDRRLQQQRVRESNLRRKNNIDENFYCAAFNYDPTTDYSEHSFVKIGSMDQICEHCNALKFKNESPGICCAGGKVKLPVLKPPPQPLNTLLSGSTSESKHFLNHIAEYNACFAMTSFGASNIIKNKFMPTFKVYVIISIKRRRTTIK